MFQLRRRGQVAYEDLLREMESIEKQVMGLDGSLAMSLMVLEAKLRERFHQMELSSPAAAADGWDGDDLSIEEIQALIPRDLPTFPTISEIESRRNRKRSFETVGIAAVLAIVTALGVFGLASALQFVLSWIA
jgi:hypothetical protein